jgi:hypothetical protein
MAKRIATNNKSIAKLPFATSRLSVKLRDRKDHVLMCDTVPTFCRYIRS